MAFVKPGIGFVLCLTMQVITFSNVSFTNSHLSLFFPSKPTMSSDSFRKGTIKETWKQVEPDNWFNPAFQKFVNTEIVPMK
jgi:hypothetical protein